MAQIIIRPSSTVSTTNAGFSPGSSAHHLINEVTADGDSTCIYWSTEGGGVTVRCSAPDISKIKTIKTLTLYATAKGNGNLSLGFSAPFSGGSSSTIDTSSTYTVFSYTLSVNQPPTTFDLSNVRIYFNTSNITAKGMIYLTQMYVVINYEEVSVVPFNVRVKIGGTWRSVSAIYAKVGGTWRAASKVYAKILGTWRAS